MDSRCQDLQRQNELLHEQIQAISGKMATQLQQTAGDSSLNVSLSEEGKSQEQLLEILRFLLLLTRTGSLPLYTFPYISSFFFLL